MEKTPVLFDCDPGVDDAFALSLLGSCPQFDLRAIKAPTDRCLKLTIGAMTMSAQSMAPPVSAISCCPPAAAPSTSARPVM